MAGEYKTGVCLMDMILKLDAGDVWIKQETKILPIDTSQSLSLRLSHLGAHLLYENLNNLLLGNLTRTKQVDEESSYAPMLTKEEGQLDFNAPGQELNNKVRGLYPWPVAFGFFKGRRLKFFDSFFVPTNNYLRKMQPGRIATIKPYLGVECINGIIFFQALQWEGKKIMLAHEALRQNHLVVGDLFI